MADDEQAKRIALQKLMERSAADCKAIRDKRRAKPYEPWRGAAARFKGLGEALMAQIQLRNISRDKEGYTVSIMRRGKSFGRYFGGLSDETLAMAVQFRDEALKILGEARANTIPARVLKALALPAHVPGISRDTARSAYSVNHTNAKGKQISRLFSFVHVPEEDAYAVAIEFLEGTLKKGQ